MNTSTENRNTAAPLPASDDCGRAATVGTFDGVHEGHRLLLGTLAERAGELGLDPVAITFEPHPLALLAPERTPRRLTDIETRSRLISATGVRPMKMEFNDAIRRMRAVEWLRWLHDRLGVRLLLVGYDNTFGSDGLAMSVADYQTLGHEVGITIEEAPLLPGVSSSAIRKAIAAGDVSLAARMLGRPYELKGTVVHGQGLGQQLGFPTANVEVPDNFAVPARGVYAARARLEEGTEIPAMVNIGLRPTAGDFNDAAIEAHLIGWRGDLYGKRITLAFIGRLRDEQHFPSLEALCRQLEKDAEATAALTGDDA